MGGSPSPFQAPKPCSCRLCARSSALPGPGCCGQREGFVLPGPPARCCALPGQESSGHSRLAAPDTQERAARGSGRTPAAPGDVLKESEPRFSAGMIWEHLLTGPVAGSPGEPAAALVPLPPALAGGARAAVTRDHLLGHLRWSLPIRSHREGPRGTQERQAAISHSLLLLEGPAWCSDRGNCGYHFIALPVAPNPGVSAGTLKVRAEPAAAAAPRSWGPDGLRALLHCPQSPLVHPPSARAQPGCASLLGCGLGRIWDLATRAWALLLLSHPGILGFLTLEPICRSGPCSKPSLNAPEAEH